MQNVFNHGASMCASPGPIYNVVSHPLIHQSNTVYIKSRAIHDPESKKDVDSFLSILEMLKKKQNFNQYIYSQ